MPEVSPKVAVVLISAGTAIAYWLTGLAGLQLTLADGQISPVWPATGVALFCLVRWGWRAAPGVLIGALLATWEFGAPPLGVLFNGLGNTLAAVAAWQVLRLVGFRPELDRIRDAVALIVLGGVAAVALSATLGTSALIAAEAMPAEQFWTTWAIWLTGDLMGVLMVAPALFALWYQRPQVARPQRVRIEAAVLITATVCAAVLGTETSIGILFPTVIPLIWAAVRFQLLGAASCALLTSVLVSLAAIEGNGPFAGKTVLATMIALQVYNGSLALIALLLSTAITERNKAQAAVEETCEVLADALTRLGEKTGLGERTLAAIRRATTAPEPEAGLEQAIATVLSDDEPTTPVNPADSASVVRVGVIDDRRPRRVAEDPARRTRT
ncbi:MASE1 domain-containing protein [Thermocrispum municipale]|uniref:MASE1 domain-containing protein n=1 Tax=Thermocrispum municipale TaxID=37926 RepID=UPI00146FA4C8|nr:MASE1 domain-containing protein [Thermocrispum municipale]